MPNAQHQNAQYHLPSKNFSKNNAKLHQLFKSVTLMLKGVLHHPTSRIWEPANGAVATGLRSLQKHLNLSELGCSWAHVPTDKRMQSSASKLGGIQTKTLRKMSHLASFRNSWFKEGKAVLRQLQLLFCFSCFFSNSTNHLLWCLLYKLQYDEINMVRWLSPI